MPLNEPRRRDIRRLRRRVGAAFRLAEPRVRLALRHHRTTRGGPMTFRRRPYLLPIYLDRSPERVFKKSVQCGISEFLIIDAFDSAARGLACLYVMPTQQKRDKFVAHRVTRAINASPHYRRLVRVGPGRANSARLKHFGDGVISFVGSNAENEFVEFPADLVIIDEVDRCNLNNLPLARDRLAASPHKLIAYASTPTHAEVGVAARYDESDAREWHVTCEHCGHRQPLDFFVNVARRTGNDEYELIDREWDGRAEACRDVRVFCADCARPVDRLGEGEWVARYPARPVAGYHISQLFVPTVSVARLWADWGRALRNEWERQRFYNSLLGEPYAAGSTGLTADELLACADDYALPPRAERCTMGVDVGEWLHVRISDRPRPGVRRAVFIGKVKTLDRLDGLLDRYDVRCCVIDAQPEAMLVRKWQARHEPGRIWRCLYTDDDVRRPRKDAREGIVRVGRTASLDDSLEDILMRRNVLPRNARTLDHGDYVAQMTAPRRQTVETPTGGRRTVWTRGAADHHRHADNYDKIASALRQPDPATMVVTGARRRFPTGNGRLFRAA